MTRMQLPELELKTAYDPRAHFDDPLLDGLLILCQIHGCDVSRTGLSAGLPLANLSLNIDLLPRAAARAGLQARVLRRELDAIDGLNLPVLLLLKGNRCAGEVQ